MEPIFYEDNQDYKFYMTESQGVEKRIFEFLNESDFVHFQQGLRRGNARYWRQRPSTAKMLEKMNENKGRTFVVKFNEEETAPFIKNRY